MSEQRRFVISEYFVNESTGCFEVSLGENHICPRSNGDEPCQLKFKYQRFRKTGPAHCLWVVMCQIHSIGFTIYPPGFVPYGRKIVQFNIDLSQSLLEAANDAGENILWPSSGALSGGNVRTTQSRHMRLILKLFGFDLDLNLRIQIANHLGLEPHLIAEIFGLIRDGPRLRRAWGQEIKKVFKSLSSPCPILKLIECGKLAGLWADFVNWTKPFKSTLI